MTQLGCPYTSCMLSLCMYNNTNLTTAKNAYRAYLSSILRTDKLGSAPVVCMSFISMKQTEKNVKPMIHKLSSSNSPLLPGSSCFPDCTLLANPELDLEPGDKSSIFCAEGILGMRTSDIFLETGTLVLKKSSKK